jgi:hypothetical protein
MYFITRRYQKIIQGLLLFVLITVSFTSLNTQAQTFSSTQSAPTSMLENENCLKKPLIKKDTYRTLKIGLHSEAEGMLGLQKLEMKMGYRLKFDKMNVYLKSNEGLFIDRLKTVWDLELFPKDGRSTNLSAIKYSFENKEGSYYEKTKKFADEVAKDGRYADIAFLHEANASPYPWNFDVNGNNFEDYIPTFRLISKVFKDSGANVNIVQWLNRLNGKNRQYSIANLYAGKDYVDAIAVTNYNRVGTSPQHLYSKSFAATMQDFYDQYLDMNFEGKETPLIVAESSTNDVKVPGYDVNKEEWFRQMGRDIQQKFPKISTYMLFAENKIQKSYNGYERNWGLNTDSEVKAFEEVGKSLQSGTPIEYSEDVSKQFNKNIVDNPLMPNLDYWYGQNRLNTKPKKIVDPSPLPQNLRKGHKRATNLNDVALSPERPACLLPSSVNSIALTVPGGGNDYDEQYKFNIYKLSKHPDLKKNATINMVIYAKATKENMVVSFSVKQNSGKELNFGKGNQRLGKDWQRFELSTVILDNAGTYRVPNIQVGQNSQAGTIFVTGFIYHQGEKSVVNLL